MHLVLVRFKAWLESLDYARSMRGENGSNLSPTTQWVNAFFFKLWMDRGYLQIWHIQDEDHRQKDEHLRLNNKTSLQPFETHPDPWK